MGLMAKMALIIAQLWTDGSLSTWEILLYSLFAFIVPVKKSLVELGV
jgi:hypothetical protein